MFPGAWLKPAVLLLGTLVLQGCTSFDPLDQRGETVNRNATDYANDATLLNVVRASLSEPMAFVTITGYSGTHSINGSVGLPSFVFGPNVTNTYTIGPNTVTRNNQNTVQMSVVDDPKSFAALLTPLTPALLAAFINQGYPRSLLFFLFVDEIREMEVDARGNETGVVKSTLLNQPGDPNWPQLQGTLATLLYQGLVARIDVNEFPAGGSFPPSQLCIDPYAIRPAFGPGIVSKRTADALDAAPKDMALCQNAPWMQPQAAKSDSSTSSPLSTGGKAKPAAKAAATPKPPPHLVAYPLIDQKKRHFELTMRSTYGIYNYVGALLAHHTDIDNLQQPDASGSGGFINVTTGKSDDCFAAVDYRGVTYCVPNKATNTKQLFTLLHQLQQLLTAPANTTAPLLTIPAS